MDEVFVFLIIVVVVLTIVTLVGHGIWATIAFLIRTLSSGSPRGGCTQCGQRRVKKQDAFCPRCKVPYGLTGTDLRASDALAAGRQLKQFVEQGTMDLATHNHWMELLRQQYFSAIGETPAEAPDVLALLNADELPTSPKRTLPSRADIEPQSARAAADTPSVPPAETADIVFAEVVDEAPARAAPPADSAGEPSPLTPVPVKRSVSFDDLPAREPAAPRRSFADLLSGFMEEKNIRWGELISGILIVGSAIGLVVSLRSTFSRFPYFSPFLFMLITLAIFGAGMYTLKRWTLVATSRGVLTISLLLVPLNFLAAVVLPNDAEVTGGLYWTAVVVGISVFSLVVYWASRALLKNSWWQLMLGVLGPCVGQLIVDSQAHAAVTAMAATLLFGLAWLSLLVSTSGNLFLSRRSDVPLDQRMEQLLLLLGLSAFSFAGCVSLFFLHSETASEALRKLSPTLAIAAIAMVTCGLTIYRECHAAAFVKQRIAGTAIALFGTLLSLASLAFAATDPPLLACIAIAQFVLLSGMATSARLAILHYAGVGCLSLAVLTLVQLVWGPIVVSAEHPRFWLWEILWHGRACLWLLGLSIAVAGGGVVLGRLRRPDDAFAWLASGGVLAGLSLLLAMGVGFLNGPQLNAATWVFFLYAAASLTVGAVANRSIPAAAGAAILLIGLFHAFAFNEALLIRYPWSLSLLVHASTVAILGMGLHFARPTASRQAVDAFSFSAVATSVFAVPFVLRVYDGEFYSRAAMFAWIACIWFVAGSCWRRKLQVSAFQLAACLSTAYFVAGYAHAQDWGTGWITDIRHIQWQIGVLGIASLACAAINLVVRRAVATRDLLEPHVELFSQSLHGILVGLLVLVSLIMSWPGLCYEHGYVDHPSTFSQHLVGGWWMWLSIFAGAVWQLYAQPSRPRVAAIGLVYAIAIVLLSIHFEPDAATATVMRWGFAIYSLAAAMKLLAFGLAPERFSFAWRFLPHGDRSQTLRGISNDFLLLTVVPVFGLTIWSFVDALNGIQPQGPAAVWFFRIGDFAAYSIPLVLTVISLVLYAVSCRRERYLLLGSLALQASVTMACALAAHLAGKPFDGEFLASLLQWNGVALAGFGLLWLAVARWVPWDKPGFQSLGITWNRSVYDLQVVSTLAAVAVLAIWIMVRLFLVPEDDTSGIVKTLGRWPGYFSVLASCVMVSIYHRREKALAKGISLIGWPLSVLVALIAATVASYQPAASWRAYYTLVAGWLILAALLTLLLTRTKVKGAGTWCPLILTMLATLFALRATFVDPQSPWTSGGAIVCCMVLYSALGLIRRKPLLAYAGTATAAIAAGIFVTELSAVLEPETILNVLFGSLGAAGLAASFWTSIEIHFQVRERQPLDPGFPLPSVQRVVPWTALLLLLLVLPLGSLLSSTELRFDCCSPLTFVMFGTLGFAILLSVWDPAARHFLAGAYCWSVLLIIAVVDQVVQLRDDGPENLLLYNALAISCFSVIASWLWSKRRELARLAQLANVPEIEARVRRAQVWLPAFTLIVGSPLLLFSCIGVVTFELRWQQVSCGFVPALLALSCLLLVPRERASWLRGLTLTLFVIAAILLSWADVSYEQYRTEWLVRVIRAVIVTAFLAFLYGFAMARRMEESSHWRHSLWSASLRNMMVAAGLLVAVLPLEFSVYDPERGLNIDSYHVIAVSLALAGEMLTLLAFALSDKADPWNLSERGKMAYVFGAELIGLLLFGHIYLAAPWLFSGLLRQYWPFIVMAIAFAGVAFGEIAKRGGKRVLAEPLVGTGALLPLLPALGFWIVSARVDYSAVMFSIGLLYILLAMLRQSFASAIAAVIAGNVALWSLLLQKDIEFLARPQFWLIPPALCVLIAAQVNRRRLSHGQLTSIRYLCMLVIYLSSTAEVFMSMGESVWQPMVLAALAVVGVFVGMALRIRAFLYTGTCFILFAVISMVWHAYTQFQHAAIWWAFGITLGVAILALFGLLEKKREQLRTWVDQLRQWER